MIIRQATIEDRQHLVQLLNFLFEQEADFSPNTALQEKGLESIITDENKGHILIMEHQGRPIGMVNLLYTISTALGAKVALLEDMIIHPNFRHQGLGSRLLQAAIKHAKDIGCRRITLLTDLDNYTAQEFYQKHGFQSSAMKPYRLLF